MAHRSLRVTPPCLHAALPATFLVTACVALVLVLAIVVQHPEHRDLATALVLVNGTIFGTCLASAICARRVDAIYRDAMRLNALMEEVIAASAGAQKSPDPCGPGLSREEPPQQGSR